jgi:hypothetical protein
MKKSRGAYKQAHSANAKFGMGDFYGRAIPAKMGKIRSVYSPGENPVKPKALKKPPKTLA